MFRKILVAIDAPESHQAIFEEALALALANQAALMLLHVLEPFEHSSLANVYPGMSDATFRICMQQWKEREQVGIEQLRSLEERATAAGISTEFTQSVGDPGKVICELAENWQADLIIVGRRGLSGLSELFMGSISNYVLHHAHCNILTLQSTAPIPPDRELAAVAGHSA
jgi:nucleotide-binding universal stress UspA family protein